MQPLRGLSTFSSQPGLRVETHAPSLPGEVTRELWEAEKLRFQNPRIRCLLGCLNLMEAALENDYTLLHCSPARLVEILRKVRLAGASIRDELRPLLQTASRIPALESALSTARSSLQVLSGTALQAINDLPSVDSESDLRELRRVLCSSMGQILAFVQDNFVRVVAADPRSQHDIDYFLSKRFPRDVEESEWLYYSVSSLSELLEDSESRRRHLSQLRLEIEIEQMVPGKERWQPLVDYLDWLTETLIPKLRTVLKLPGIRFDEMEILEQYASDIPSHCRLVLELAEVTRQTSDRVKNQAARVERPRREQAVTDLVTLHGHFSARVNSLLETLDESLRGLAVFVPFWLHSLEGRRSLILRRQNDRQTDKAHSRKRSTGGQPEQQSAEAEAVDHEDHQTTAAQPGQ